MKYLIKNNEIVQEGLTSNFTRENGESFWGGYETMTELHFEDGWRGEVVPEYNSGSQYLGERFYDPELDAVTYPIVARADIPVVETVRTAKIKEIKMYTRDLLFDTDFYIVRRAETSKSVPQEVLTARQAIRVWSDAQEKLVNAMTTADTISYFNVHYTVI